jgi:hypothetical protein
VKVDIPGTQVTVLPGAAKLNGIAKSSPLAGQALVADDIPFNFTISENLKARQSTGLLLLVGNPCNLRALHQSGF